MPISYSLIITSTFLFLLNPLSVRADESLDSKNIKIERIITCGEIEGRHITGSPIASQHAYVLKNDKTEECPSEQGESKTREAQCEGICLPLATLSPEAQRAAIRVYDSNFKVVALSDTDLDSAIDEHVEELHARGFAILRDK